jgi:hypothetical protein
MQSGRVGPDHRSPSKEAQQPLGCWAVMRSDSDDLRACTCAIGTFASSSDSARVSGYRAGRYLLSVTATVQLEHCHPADPGRRAREATAAAHKLTVSANFKVGDAVRGGFAVRAVLHHSPGPELRAPGTPELSGSQGPCRQRQLGTKWESPALAVVPERSLLLTCASLHLREHGDDLVRKMQMHSWGQGVAGSNPAVPTRFSNVCALNWERIQP